MTRRLALLSPWLLLLTLAACGANTGDPTQVAYASTLDVDLSAMQRSDSGLYTLDQTVGSGAVEAQSGDKLKVNYSGWLPDGTLFDSSLKAGRQPFVFDVGMGEVIKGWDEGLIGMRAGGKRRLILPSSLGYGANGTTNIPPNSVLIFDVQLVSVN